MVTIECITRKWGSSIGVIIPKEIANQERIVPGKKIVLELRHQLVTGKEFFGKFPQWRGKGDELKKEMKKGWK